MKNGVKMLDIAVKLGVSVVTVSNALAGRDGVSAELRQKICETADEMGYKPSNTKTSRKRPAMPAAGSTVGIITSERFVGPKGTFYWELTALISNKLSAMNISTMYECISGESEKNGILPNMVTENKVDAVIVIGQIHRSYSSAISQISLPLIFVDFYDNRFKVDSVNSDSYHGGYVLTDYLVEMGHTKIGFIGTINATSSINDRFLGYMKCLIESHLDYRPEWTISDRNERGILHDKLDFPEEMPTAFVCNCDETAFRVINALKSKGVRVPEDISVVGYDNYVVSNICIPTITTIEVNLDKMASASVGLIMRKLENPGYSGGRRIISGDLIIKESVLDLRSRSSRV